MMKTILNFCLVVMLSLSGFSQEKTITGAVTSADDGLPLPGANVIIKGTTRGEQTDFDGKYSIKASAGEILVFSYVGFKNVEVLISASNIIDVSLEISEALDEVVVTGYKTRTKRKSSVSSVRVVSESIETRKSKGLVTTLSGSVKGLKIKSSEGAPGADTIVKLRGISSIFGTKRPLIILDGNPISESELKEMKPEKIKSIEILKDADSTAIYGNRGSNGVVVIKTKDYLTDDSSELVGKSEDIGQEYPHSLLTAAEINDLEKWEDWIIQLRKKQNKEIQKNWEFGLENKIDVSVKDNNDIPVNNAKVSLYNSELKKIMEVRTDVFGKAILFSDLHELCNDKFLYVQVLLNEKIVGKKITNNCNTLNFILDQEIIANDIDVMFTIDATGSMGDEMDYLKAELSNIFNRLDNSIEKKRLALTFYRDHGDEFVVRDFDFNSNIRDVQNILRSHKADGGGDYEEAVEKALAVSMSKSWNIDAKSKLLFLLLDAPPHFNEDNVKTIKVQISIAQSKGIKIIPIVASDANKDLEFLMRFFSVSTNGTYVFLTDDSGIGNEHLKPSTDDYKVEKLNDLIVRLIEKYSGVIS
ncbi:carboxypeptidase-like regulatory domain-containing protein [Ichthyenterobacterium sp. W332]|uniref:Carboxypeptidase-like regulatory domain-containing protein n=1 Tax=Microcosmobacter mediterraneus TaxID=3075607 RepID=A0ABU2YMN6_9FLAO|nr:carboxypeptidase-like regulatory domain-containing protein [Ichthyenterobacterium sp. W332]MDT0559430.1 carboxypeptidase-like regulatory domain-containing protein [Ichthyenterobacterium sp. W332]